MFLLDAGEAKMQNRELFGHRLLQHHLLFLVYHGIKLILEERYMFPRGPVGIPRECGVALCFGPLLA